MSMLMAQQPFVDAEVGYRTARAGAQYSHTHRRFHVPRRPTLRLPRPRPRPAVAA
jgi:hypothetical protein